MQVLVKTELKHIPVTSVILTHDYDDYGGYKLKMFFCPNCQKAMFQYKGNIQSIIVGESPLPIPIILKCSNNECRKVYSIQAIT